MEYLDILDEKGNLASITASYDEAHKKGLIHRTVHVWLVNSNGQLLLQLRKADRAAYPNHWDISAAGHISAGETSIEGAKKEVREELGLTLKDTDLKFLYTIRSHEILNGGLYVANEFQDVYVVHSDVKSAELNLQESEVSEVRWMDVTEIKDWLAGTGEPIVPHPEEYERLFTYLETT